MKRWILTIVWILLLSCVVMCTYPLCHQAVKRTHEEEDVFDRNQPNSFLIEAVYDGIFVEYSGFFGEDDWVKDYVEGLEQADEDQKDSQNKLVEESSEEKQAYEEACKNELENAMYSLQMEYNDNWNSVLDSRGILIVVKDPVTGEFLSNCNEDLQQFYDQFKSGSVSDKVNDRFSDVFSISFDEMGNFGCEIIKSALNRPQMAEQLFRGYDREDSFEKNLNDYSSILSERRDWRVVSPKNVQMLVFFEEDADLSLASKTNYINYYTSAYATYLIPVFAIVMGLMLLFTLVITSKKVVGVGDFRMLPKWFPGILAVVILIPVIGEFFYELINQIYVAIRPTNFSEVIVLLSGKDGWENGMYLIFLLFLHCLFFLFGFVVLYEVVILFRMGLIKYCKENAWLYQIGLWIARRIQSLKKEVLNTTLSKKTLKTVRKIVILNFLLLAVLSCFWFIGIIGLILYSIAVYVLAKRYMEKVQKDYEKLVSGMQEIAAGDLNVVFDENMGVFEPIKEQVSVIQDGFQAAVSKEVKAERMKTDLITNVSHDLKTPLTAITTYVELLKNPDISEEERKSYIQTLSDKSLRLKVLIEDLFEVTKANSGTIQLNLMELDICNLIKQVMTEHEEKYAELGLKVCYQLPEEKVMLSLDPEKSYRIFENLFGNIQKYAMPNSRVYVDILLDETSEVRIVIKNMSATELNIDPSEIMERFVRGDASRNTEGSGLGLAIAQSLTEAQKGEMLVEIDGDLFKVTLQWKKIENIHPGAFE